MSTFTNFAIVGAGNVGKPLINEFLKLKADGAISSVTLVTRSDTRDPAWESKGLRYATINYEVPSTLVGAFKGVEVVISTVTFTGLESQKALARAAKEAGVKLFSPSEYGGQSHRGGDHFIYQAKKATQDYLREINLPYTAFYTGPMPGMFLVPYFKWDLAGGKVTYGAGDKPMSFTDLPDVVRFVVYAFTKLPLSKLEWGIIRIEGERTTFDEIVKAYESKTGKSVEITRLSSEEIKELKKAGDVFGVLYADWEEGGGVVGEPDNDLYPEWNPKKVIEVIA